MKDERLDALLREAKQTYRVPPEAPLDAMWERIERESFDAPRRRAWLAPLAGIAATLLVGFGVGRFTAPADGVPTVIDRARDLIVAGPAPTVDRVGQGGASKDVAEPLRRATYEYLARAVALLDSLPRSAQAIPLRSDARFVADASQLLGTTRLLLDSPAASDPRMRALLEDLELVLAQVSRLRTAPRADELTFIAEAMDERAVVPRLRTVTASYTASGY